MKNIIYSIIFLVISITLTSAIQKKSESTKSFVLQAIGNKATPVLLKQSADIISARLKSSGINLSEIKVSADKCQLNIVLTDRTDMSGIEGLLTSRGELAFYETYTHDEITDLLKPENPLFTLLANHQDAKQSDPRVGCSGTENRKKADEYIRSSVPFKNCKLFWGYESEKSGYCLFALKTNDAGKPLMVRSDIESVKIAAGKDSDSPKIQIKLKSSSVSVFAEATKKNLHKSIAIVIDDQVYSWPVVQSVIEGGEIEVTGSFTEKEVNYFPVIFNSQPLPLSFKLLR